MLPEAYGEALNVLRVGRDEWAVILEDLDSCLVDRIKADDAVCPLS